MIRVDTPRQPASAAPARRAGITSGLRRDHFALLASRWSDYGPPLRPSPFDTLQVQAQADALNAGARVLVLGLTPETVACHWPDRVQLFAIDHSPAVMSMLWPNAKGPKQAQAILGSWEKLPFPDRSIDLVCGDGCQIGLRWPDGIDRFHQEVRRVLKAQGTFLTRVFTRPETPEPLADIERDFAGRRIASVHGFKLRLLAAMQAADDMRGTVLDAAWQVWTRFSSTAEHPEEPGWTRAERATLDGYRGVQTRFFLPTLNEFRTAVRPLFVEQACVTGDYPLAKRCPTLLLRPT